MRTYRELFRTPEFTPLFFATSAQVAAGTMSGLALGSLVYAATRSALLSALSMFGPSFAQLLGATTLLSAVDRLPPRAVLGTIAAVYTVGTAAVAAPGMPLWGRFALVMALGLAGSMGGAVRWGLLSEILPEGGYVLGRSVFNMSVGVMQIAGFAAGGALLAVLSPPAALLTAAGLYLSAVVVIRTGLTRRPPRAAGRPSVRETWRVNTRLWSHAPRRHVYLALWVPNGLVVGCEALYVPYAPDAAGALFVSGALGMLAADTALGRFVPAETRGRLVTPLRLLLAAPYLLFALPLPLPVAVAAVAVASAGFGASLLLQDRLVALTPGEMRGQALGLHSSGMMAMQAIGASLAGLTAQFVPPGTAMVLMAGASLAVTIALTPRLRASAGVREPAAAGSAAPAGTTRAG
ncbi:membrane protein [Sphaerisporangium melleum]|uniref:Membrane protein n=1 Tax=Sphaerisporangium melleum TaxID=321316 RepID=A0A917VQF4_9ACTN|nr:MFS transporter [Sphaerisporangium melleum]GGL07623.1 membrane protein [Sphaerisporangium melleum]GII68666.1 membrane protein [Sphaerisporangium melleum]